MSVFSGCVRRIGFMREFISDRTLSFGDSRVRGYGDRSEKKGLEVVGVG